MSVPPTCFLDLPPDTVRLILASLDTWTAAVDDLAFARWWNAMTLSCTWLNSVCKGYDIYRLSDLHIYNVTYI